MKFNVRQSSSQFSQMHICLKMCCCCCCCWLLLTAISFVKSIWIDLVNIFPVAFFSFSSLFFVLLARSFFRHLAKCVYIFCLLLLIPKCIYELSIFVFMLELVEICFVLNLAAAHPVLIIISFFFSFFRSFSSICFDFLPFYWFISIHFISFSIVLFCCVFGFSSIVVIIMSRFQLLASTIISTAIQFYCENCRFYSIKQ